MYVCVCKGITDTQIKDAVYGGATSLRDVRRELGVMSQCGKCGVFTKQLVDEALQQHSLTSNLNESLFYSVG